MQKDLTNNKFGRLTAIIYAGKTKDRHSKWLCRCDCGNEVVVKCAIQNRQYKSIQGARQAWNRRVDDDT